MAKSLIVLPLILVLAPFQTRAGESPSPESATPDAKEDARRTGADLRQHIAVEAAARDNLQNIYRNIADKVLPSTVKIDFRIGWRYHHKMEIKEEVVDYASGFIVDSEQGLIVTNSHVVNDIGRKGILQKPHKEKDGVNFVQIDHADFMVTLANGQKITATVIDFDDDTDLALVQVDPKQATEPLQAIIWGDDKKLHVGDLIAVVGSPYDLRNSVTYGYISALGRKDFGMDVGSSIKDYIQHNASSNQGNSGGVLANAEAAFIGVPSAHLAAEGSVGSIGLGFAIPAHHVREMLDRYRAEGRVHATQIGLDVEPAPWGGLKVTKVVPGFSAWTNIIEGDLIIAVDGMRWMDGPTSEFGPSRDDYVKAFKNYIKEKSRAIRYS